MSTPTESETAHDRGLGTTGPERRLDQLKRARLIRLAFAAVGLLFVGALFRLSLTEVGFSIGELLYYWPKFVEALTEYFPPGELFGFIPFLDVGRYWAFVLEKDLFKMAVVTLAMGFAGTIIGAPGALLLGVLGSERVVPFPFNFVFRGIMSIIRAIPALVWALIFIPLGGVSPFTATLAIAVDTFGNLGRLFTDELEEVSDGPIEGIRSTGANSRQTIVFGMLSQVVRPFIAWTMYILEINVRIAVGLGIIGAGGLGYVLVIQRGLFHYTNMMATIFFIMGLVVVVEMISQRTRSYLRGGDEDDAMGLLERLLTLPRRTVESMAR